MFCRKKLLNLFILLLTIATFGACKKSAETASNSPAQKTEQVSQSQTIETETVALAPIAAFIPATGKILVPEDRMANIGPVHEGRIVRLYAGQGSVVRKDKN